ncbi:MAG: hypothetical protein H0U40_12960, partial [Chloroflexia bacterium]|nr:hypothetical protein [Chloroflexia bacterium]
RIAAPAKLEVLARQVAKNIEVAIGILTEVSPLDDEQRADAWCRLANRECPLAWDILIHDQDAQAADSVGQEMHAAFAGEMGAFRA